MKQFKNNFTVSNCKEERIVEIFKHSKKLQT